VLRILKLKAEGTKLKALDFSRANVAGLELISRLLNKNNTTKSKII
jgi:hypothetical protein